LFDGRNHRHARVAAVVVTSALTTIGLGLATASPATAAPNDIDAAQARVDRLSQQAQSAGKRHDATDTTLTRSRTQLDRLTTGIKHQRRVMDNLRAQVAGTVVGAYDGAGGASAPSTSLTKDSEVMLTNVTVVSEDAGRRGDDMTSSNAQLQQLNQRRIAVREQVKKMSVLEKTLRKQQEKVDSRAANAGAVLDDLEAAAAEKRMAALGGPAVAYAKSQVGKSYVWGAAGPDSFDCSGLTMMAWQQAGVSLPHNSTAQYDSGQQISESELQPGDLVFYYSPISHVGIYIGDGQIVSALNPGAGINIRGLHDMPYAGAVRVG